MDAVRVDDSARNAVGAPSGTWATGVRWVVTGVEILLVGLAVPAAILLVGVPLALGVKLVLQFVAWL